MLALDTMPSEKTPEGVVPALATSPPDRHQGSDSPRVVSSDMLLAGRSQLAILHNETIYFLRQTRFGKLILTK
jgi:hemin uptake protein HemP